MNILIITPNIGRTAPGIVFERLAYGLSINNNIDIIVSDYDPSLNLNNIKNILVSRKININYHIRKLIISLFGFDITGLLESLFILENFKKQKYKKYDIVLSFLSFNCYVGLIAGKKIAKILQCKHVVYSVDAIPVPQGWPISKRYKKGILKLIKKQLYNIDGFYSANEQMLSYQLSLFKTRKNIYTGVIFNPSLNILTELGEVNNDHNIFLYTGVIYGARKSSYIFKAFKKLLQHYPDSQLVFVGTKVLANDLNIFSDQEREKILFHPYSSELISFYSEATALLDIDADIPNDVFLSSKIVNYITINRIIISETGKNSPSRHIFKNIPSIIQCDHKVDEIFSAMKFAIEEKNNIDYSDRKEVLDLFNLSNIIDKFQNELKSISEL